MGQAKSRGTFDQRKKAAIKRNEKSRIERINHLAEIERNKTPEQRQREREAQIAYAQMLALANPYLPIYKSLRGY